MRIIKSAQVLWLRRVGVPDLTRLDSQIGLSKTATVNKYLDYCCQ